MKSLDDKQNPTDTRDDLYARSYSPTLRVLVVAAIFIIAIFLLGA